MSWQDFILTGREASGSGAVDALMGIPVIKPKALLADKDYDGDAARDKLLIRGILPIILLKSNRREPVAFNVRRYRDRNRTKRMVCHKQFRRFATRYDKTALFFASFLDLAEICKWPPHFVNATYVPILLFLRPGDRTNRLSSGHGD
ncbi:hypothetical protein [Sphingobium sp. WCS2017Hpa-17]|uniref:hypothetical protein n=1 Tax=Sphingobium sp. WCS2017Hpa-17 TaxID=3073638 RepID=UPI00288B12D3|nr:hypothetical protein [Sphingobium sp. WCS2017Hpa-17]